MAKKDYNAQVRLGLDARDFNTKINDAKRNLLDFTGGLQGGFGGLSKSLKGTAAMVGTVAAGIEGVRRGVEQLKEDAALYDRLQTAGLNPRMAGQIELASLRAGTTPDTFVTAYEDFQRRIGEAEKGEGEAIRYLKQFGLDNKQFYAMSGLDQMLAVNNAANRLPTQAQRATALDKTIGGQGFGVQSTLDQLQRLTPEQRARLTPSTREIAQSYAQQEFAGDTEAATNRMWRFFGNLWSGSIQNQQAQWGQGSQGRVALGAAGGRTREIELQLENNDLLRQQNKLLENNQPTINQ